MNSAIATGWALVCLAAGIALLVASARIGRRRAAAWLVVLGIAVLTVEEGGLTLWFALADRSGDPDRLAGLVTPVARARIVDAAVFGLAVAALQCWIALTAYRRDEVWARRLLTFGLVVAALTVTATTVFVSDRGLPLPVPAEPAGFGWQPVAVALVVWAVGLWHGRKIHDGRLAATRDVAVAPEHAYAAIMSAAGLPEWFAGVSQVDADPDWPAPGTRMRWTVRTSLRFEAAVVTADPPRHVALDVRTPTAGSRVAHDFAELPTGHTRYTKTVTPTYRGWVRAVSPVLNLVLRWSIRQEVTRAARYAAARPPMADADHDRPSVAR